MNNKFEEATLKAKVKITKFLTVGGAAAFVGLIATSEQLATNPVAQQVGLVSVAVAAMGFIGAAWQAASLDDLKNGRTLKSELAEMKHDFNSTIQSFRNKFTNNNDEPVVNRRNRLLR